MTFEEVSRDETCWLTKCVSGSRAYNLALPGSDTDIKGIFVLPRDLFYGLGYVPQVSNASNDEVFFEIGRLMELLCKNNPNILELLSTPADSVLYRHPLMELIRPEDFLSRLCLDSFAGYAKTQIRKARGLNKKINQSFARERKPLLDFCHVVDGKKALPLRDWLLVKGFKQEDCGLTAIDHFRDAYLLYHGTSFKGIVSGPDANEVLLSSVPADMEPSGVMHFNKDGYSVYCKEYAEYWQWVSSRNDVRYQQTLSHGKNYDAKHMMHTFRLLEMAAEIAVQRRVIVHREDRDFLLRIRSGEFEYEELMGMVDERIIRIEELYAKSDLPAAPDIARAEKILVRIRKGFYGG